MNWPTEVNDSFPKWKWNTALSNIIEQDQGIKSKSGIIFMSGNYPFFILPPALTYFFTDFEATN